MTQPRSVESEQQTRESLAALYRILDRYGMSDLANQEVGARIGEQPDHYLVHPYGTFYDEVTAPLRWSRLINRGSPSMLIAPG